MTSNAQLVLQGMNPACAHHVQDMVPVSEHVANELAGGVRVVVYRHDGEWRGGHAAIAVCGLLDLE